MDSGRIAATAAALHRLRDDLGPETDGAAAIRAMRALLGRAEARMGHDPAWAGLARQRVQAEPSGSAYREDAPASANGSGGLTVLAQARRVLDGPARADDVSAPISALVPFTLHAQPPITLSYAEQLGLVMAALTRQIDHGTPAQRAKQAQLQHYALIDNLAHCLEDEGNQVCPVGVSERLLLPLSGTPYCPAELGTPVPQEVALYLTRRFDFLRRGEAASDADWAQLLGEAQVAAQHNFPAQPGRQAAVLREVNAYRDLVLDEAS